MFSLRKTRFYWRFKVDSEEQVWVFSKDLRVSGNQLFSIMPKYTLKVNIKKKKKNRTNIPQTVISGCLFKARLYKTLSLSYTFISFKLFKPPCIIFYNLNKSNKKTRIFTASFSWILLSPDAKSWLTGKDPDAGRDWGREEKGMTDDEMARWHHRPNGHEFE